MRCFLQPQPQSTLAAKLSLKVCLLLVLLRLCFRLLKVSGPSIGYFLLVNVLYVSFRGLISLPDMLIRADAPVMGTLWEFILATDIEIG